MGIDTVDAKYCEHNELSAKIKAVIAGKHELIKLVTALPAPMYRDLTTVNGCSSEQISALQRQQILQTKRKVAYWQRGVLMNATGRTHVALDGMLWSKDPAVDISPKLAYMERSADGQGNSLRDVVQGITDEALASGRVGILVDMPQSKTNLTLAQMELPEYAPRLITYTSEQIRYIRNSGKENGLDEVRLGETHSVPVNDLDWEDVEYIRRLVIKDGIYYNQLWDDKQELIEESTPKSGGQYLTKIPFYYEDTKPPLLDLAMVNIAHFVLDCDDAFRLHMTDQGIFIIKSDMDRAEFDDANPNGLDVNPSGINMVHQGDDVQILQPAANTGTAAKMQSYVEYMKYLGAQLVQDANTNVTLGAKSMEFGASTATLKRLGRNISIGVEWCLDIADGMLGGSYENQYRLNDKFITDDLTPELINAYFGLVQGEVLPRSIIYDMVRQQGVTEKTDDELIEAVAMQSTGGTTEEVAAMQAEIDSLKLQLSESE